jgi:polysaccharide export outer membrane protein
MTLKKLPFLLVMALSVSGCALLPRNGPDDSRILSQSADHLKSEEPTLGYEYVAVDLTSQIIPLITQDKTSSFKTFGASAMKAPSIRLGVGDVIQITVFEDQAGGLFIPEEAGVRPGNFVTLPSQEISPEGMITVPYAGKIRAAGKSPSTVEATIKRKLEARAINPAVTVEVVEANYARASVIGSVGNAGAFNLRSSGDRILDIIAQAGGITSANHETFVTLTRGKQSAKISYEALTTSPRENIFVAPGDNINVSSESKQYYTFGAAGSVGKFAFSSSEVHLNDAVAQAVGLNDNQADPAHVYVYRLEQKHALEAMGVDVSGFYQHDIPTVYRANFRKPDSFFMAQNFSIQDGDVVYVSNADSVAIGKFLGLATNITGSSVQLDADGTTLTR